jgi:hypothetical protein
MNKFFGKEDKPFFIGLLIMNIVLISCFEFFIIHPPDFLKKSKHTQERKNEKRR